MKLLENIGMCLGEVDGSSTIYLLLKNIENKREHNNGVNSRGFKKSYASINRESLYDNIIKFTLPETLK